MNAERLLTHYEKIADAPEAISRLRRYILDLAMRGKLVLQNPTDEPASELLIRIAKVKAHLMKEGNKRKERIEPELANGNPFVIPSGWEWVPFGKIHQLIRGVTYSKSDVSDAPDKGFLPILRANNISVRLTYDDPVFVKQERVSPEQLLRKGDFMIALSSGSKNLVGKAALVSEDFNAGFGGFCGVIRPIDASLRGIVGVYLQSDLYRDSIAAGSRGIGINNLKLETIANLHFPLPPLAEQHRIVAKVDELMALCDRLEAARADREVARDRLAAASLARLNAPDPDTFEADARFTLDALPALSTRPDQIKQLRQTILNLAVRGKLVPQDPKDEPAVELLKRIAVEKSRRVKQGTLREPKLSLPVANDEVEFPLCRGWQWVRLNEVIKLWNGFAFKSGDFQSAGVPVIRIGDLQDGEVTLSGTARVSEAVAKTVSAEVWIPPDALLIAMSGATTGKTAFNRTGTPLLLNQRVGRIEVFLMSVKFLRFFFETIVARNLSISFGTAIPNLSAQQINDTVVPLPPLAEQHRIVAKVDELMALCDRLETILTTGDDIRRRLLDALLAEALAPIEAREMEVAQ